MLFPTKYLDGEEDSKFVFGWNTLGISSGPDNTSGDEGVDHWSHYLDQSRLPWLAQLPEWGHPAGASHITPTAFRCVFHVIWADGGGKGVGWGVWNLPYYSQLLDTNQQTCWKTSSFKSRLVPLTVISSLSLVQDERHSGPWSRSSQSMSSVSESWRVLSESLRVTLQLRDPTLPQDLESFEEEQNVHSTARHPVCRTTSSPSNRRNQLPGAVENPKSHPPNANW